MNISINLSGDQTAVLERAFESSRFKTKDELAPALLQLAASAWIDWISGSKRYNSLTEQYTDWIEQIYEALLPESEAPSPERLFNSFNVPFGQAQYIARVLNNRSMARWRVHALNQLKNRLLERKTEVYSWIEQNREMEKVEIPLLRPAALELEILVERLFQAAPDEVDIPSSVGSRNLAAVKITARTYKKVCELLNI